MKKPQQSAELLNYRQCLLNETRLLKEWLEHGHFANDDLEIGSEIEFFIFDNEFMLSPQNIHYINELNDQSVIPEISAAQLEINSSHHILMQDALSKLHANLLNLWQRLTKLAEQKHGHFALIGTIPYFNKEGWPRIDLTGHERYNHIKKFYKKNSHSSFTYLWRISILSMMSAFQLHLKIPFTKSKQFYNIAQILAAPMLAVASNSAFLYGKKLWHESRIAIFEQATSLLNAESNTRIQAAFFGNNYLKESFFELFEENLVYPVWWSAAAEEIEKLKLVRLQNSFVYRWNRPVIDFDNNTKPHLRIEHRGPAVGPTIVDMIANAAFYYGLMQFFGEKEPLTELLPFQHAKYNFYTAAQNGLDAKFKWFKNRRLNAITIINELLPLARRGLQELHIYPYDIDFYLNVIAERIRARQNGSVWQLAFINKYGKDFKTMLTRYIEYQQSELPIARWRVN